MKVQAQNLSGITRRVFTGTLRSMLLLLGAVVLPSACTEERTLPLDFSSKPRGELIDVGDRIQNTLVREQAVHATASAKERFGDVCNGLVEEEPAFTMRLGKPMPLRILVHAQAEADLTVVISGRYTTRCNDDFEGKDPGMQVHLPQGDYDIYVGSVEAHDAAIPYRLELMPADLNRPFQGLSRNLLLAALQRRDAWTSEATALHIQELQQQLEIQKDAFDHDVPTDPPQLQAAAQHGRIDVEASLSGALLDVPNESFMNAALWPIAPTCGGYVRAEGPDVILRIPRAFEGSIECSVSADSLVELAIQAPDDTWQCGGRQAEGGAALEWEPWVSGDHRVFVVSTLPNATVQSELHCKSDGE